MLRTVGRLLLLRVLPRKILPLYTAWELYRFVRGRGRDDDRRGDDRSGEERPPRRRR